MLLTNESVFADAFCFSWCLFASFPVVWIAMLLQMQANIHSRKSKNESDTNYRTPIKKADKNEKIQSLQERSGHT